MPSDVLNFNKPCSACRRRKVRCDKAQPCNNCVRHGVSCVYEAPRESVMTQQLLQDRVERLERMVEDMAAFSRSNSDHKHSQRSSCSSGNSPFSSSDDCSEIPADAGSQVFRPANSYHMGPDSWLTIDQFSHEPRHLLNVDFDDLPEEEEMTWPLSPSCPKPKDMSHFHLPTFKEDNLLALFFQHVEPFIRMSHQPYYWQMVAEFRQGTHASSREIEALMFATQYITAAVLPSALIQSQIGVAKSDLSNHLQKATEFALDRANLMRSRNTILFSALVYYITCQFHIGNCEVGSTMLGLAGNIARRIGMHKDPAYYGYAAWIVELRRRMWGHIAALDAQSATMDGSEALLISLGDVQRSLNTNDAEWKPSPSVGSDPGPRDRDGFSDTAAALMRRELSRTCHTISEARKTTTTCEDLVAIVEETERHLRTRFINHFDGSDPMQHVITHWYNAMIKSLHVSVLYFHASRSKLKLQCHVFEQLQRRLYDDCLVCLEDFERGENAATPHHWQWAFRWPMPIHVVAGLLSGLARQPDHPDTDRAWEQVDVVFRRYNNENISMAKIPAWNSIENLCDRAMQKHPSRNHEGRAYTNRIHKNNSPHAAWEAQQKPEGISYDSMCSVDMYDNGISQPSLTQMFSTESMSVGFSASDIDTIFFNLNENNELPSIDI
ncbi:Fc.00g092730.m01.CDS01 [Cosmosporella sp. VM-42]